MQKKFETLRLGDFHGAYSRLRTQETMKKQERRISRKSDHFFANSLQYKNNCKTRRKNGIN